MIYLILDDHSRAVKVGFTLREGSRRVRDLQCANPNKIELIALIEGDYKLEKKIHHALDGEDMLFGNHGEGGTEWVELNGYTIPVLVKFFKLDKEREEKLRSPPPKLRWGFSYSSHVNGHPWIGRKHSEESKTKISRNCARRDHTIRKYHHDEHGYEECTQNELRTKYNLGHSHISQLSRGVRTNPQHGWTCLGEINVNSTD